MKKIVSLLLSMLLILSALPVTLGASAEDVVMRNYTNVARGKPVRTGNDNAFQTGSYVTDGGLGGTGVDISWGSYASPNANCYVIVDLEDVYTVNGVKVANYADTGRYYCWDVYASSDLSVWTLIAYKKSAAPSVSGGYYVETEEVDARYIKVVGTYHSANSGYHFVEVEVYSPNVYTDGDTVAASYAGSGYTAVLTADGTLTVSGTGAVGSASSAASDYPWYAKSAYVRKVIVENGVTALGAYAFAGCTGLHTLEIKGKTSLGDHLFANNMLTRMVTFGEYYTDVYVNARGTANENAIRWALVNTYGGVQWTTFEDDSILYVYGCGPLNYPNRDSVPWFLASSIRGKYEKVVVGDAITDVGMYSFSADAYGKLAEIVYGASMQQFKYQSMAYIPLASLTFLAPITYYGHYTTTGNKYSGTLEVTIASGQTSADLISKQDGYNGSSANGNDKLWDANFTNVPLRHVEWIDDTTGKALFATYVADGQTPLFPVESTYDYEGVTYEFDIPTVAPVTQDQTFHLSSRALNDYDITWIKEDTGAVLWTERAAYGTLPVYGGITRYVEDSSVYVAQVPDPEPVSGPATYTVAFTALPKHTIRWINGKTDEVICQAQVSETLLPEFTGTLPAGYTEEDVAYMPLLPPVHEVTGAEDYVVSFYADYDTADYPEIYPSGIFYKLLDEETLYIYGTGPIPSYESSGGADAPWAQYRQTVKKIIISDGITEIGACALRDYPLLEEIVLGKDVRHFLYAAFAIDYKLEYMTFLGEITYYFGHHCFSGISKALKVTQAAGQTHEDLIYQQYGHGNAAGNDQLFNVTPANYTMVPRIVARFVDGRTGETLFITSLASGSVPYFPVDLPASYTENGITYTPVLPELSAITESTTFTVAYEPDHEHVFGDWTVTGATFTSAGSKMRECSICGYSETEEIPAPVLGVYDDVIIGETDGRNTASIVGTITGADIDPTCVDELTVTLTFISGGETVRTKTVHVHGIYSTVTGLATTSEDTAGSQGIVFVEASYIFGITVKGVPSGSYDVSVKIEAIKDSSVLAAYETANALQFTV